VTPSKHHVHDHVHFLVTNDIVVARFSAFIPLFSPLKHLGDYEWSSNLLATEDCSATMIVTGVFGSVKNYQRPLQRILSVKQVEIILLIAISPHEAKPFSLIRQSKYLHIYTPRVAKAMATLEDPTSFCIPPIFSGQLYLKDIPSSSPDIGIGR
jgi:hypothetical protein